MEPEIILKELPEKIIFCKTMVIDDYDNISTFTSEAGTECSKANNTIHPDLKLPEKNQQYVFLRFLDGKFSRKNFRVEFCEAITQWGNSTETVRIRLLEKVPVAACLCHKGSTDNIGESFDKLSTWIEDNGLIANDCPRHVWIFTKDKTTGVKEVYIEIQVPLQVEKFIKD